MGTRGVSFWSKQLIVVGVVLINAGCLEDNGSTSTSDPSASSLEVVLPPFVEPPPAPTPTPNPPLTGDPLIDIPFEVVGPTRTNLDTIKIRMVTQDWVKMKVGWTANCSDGTWETITAEKTITIPQRNAKQVMSLQFSDFDYIYERCFNVEVIQDSSGPEIIFKHYPNPVIAEGEMPYIEYTVTDLSPIVETKCTLNGNTQPCASGGPNVISFTSMPAGSYQFTIAAKDDFGQSSSQTISWVVESGTKEVSQNFSMNDYRKVDILMIIDNSGSMEYEQKSMADRTKNLLSILQGLDWQIGITTTDPRNVTLGDGRLIKLNGTSSQYILNSSMDSVTAQTRLSQTLQRPETGSGSEQAINATYRAVERSLDAANNPQHRQLIRDGAHFAAFVITDEDESANGTKNDPTSLLKLIHDSFGGQKNFSFHSIITKPGDTSCKNTYGATYGDRYQTISQMTGGVIGSVCATDYTPQVEGIANGIRNLLKTMTLTCAPLAGKPITITLNGSAYTQSYVVEGVNLRFASELPPGNFQVKYHCLK